MASLVTKFVGGGFLAVAIGSAIGGAIGTEQRIPPTTAPRASEQRAGMDKKSEARSDDEARLKGLANPQISAGRPRFAAISQTATEPYRQSNYPDTVARFGKAIPAINRDREKAAQIASRDARCDGVANSQIASRSPKSNRRYWVECENLTRFRFDEASLAQGQPVSVQTIVDMAQEGLITD